MISNHNLGALMGAPVQVQGEDDKIGTVGQIFVDPESGNPNWVTVHTGLFGRRETFVPLNDATWDHEVLHVPFDKKTIKDAPRIDTDEALSPEHEADLYRYYGLGGEAAGDLRERHEDRVMTDTDTVVTDTTDTNARTDAVVADTAGAAQGPLRLRKYVVTEDKEVTVPVQHEEVRVETEGDVQVDTSAVPDLPVTRDESRPDAAAEDQPVRDAPVLDEAAQDQRTGRHVREE